MSFEALLLENGFSVEETQAIIEEFFSEEAERAEKPLFFMAKINILVRKSGGYFQRQNTIYIGYLYSRYVHTLVGFFSSIQRKAPRLERLVNSYSVAYLVIRSTYCMPYNPAQSHHLTIHTMDFSFCCMSRKNDILIRCAESKHRKVYRRLRKSLRLKSLHLMKRNCYFPAPSP